MPRPKKNKQAGAAFKELLQEKGFSNSKLAKAIGMGAGHIGRIASGEIASPTPATLEKIAAELRVELGELTMMFAQSPVRSHSAVVPQPEEEAQEETVAKNTDFVGREEAIADLNTLIVSRKVKVIGIYGKGGVVQGHGDAGKGRRGDRNWTRIETPPNFKRPNQRFERGFKPLDIHGRSAFHVPRHTSHKDSPRLRVSVSPRLLR